MRCHGRNWLQIWCLLEVLPAEQVLLISIVNDTHLFFQWLCFLLYIYPMGKWLYIHCTIYLPIDNNDRYWSVVRLLPDTALQLSSNAMNDLLYHDVTKQWKGAVARSSLCWQIVPHFVVSKTYQLLHRLFLNHCVFMVKPDLNTWQGGHLPKTLWTLVDRLKYRLLKQVCNECLRAINSWWKT